MSKPTRTALVTLVVVLVAAGVAYADATIYAGPPNQFFQGDVTIAQGEAITFQNMDTVPHDVTAQGKGGDGKPLFQSAQVGTGQSAPVEGVQYLTTGSYPYICSIHPFMKGTITVSGEGTPKPRPGGGGGAQPAGGSGSDPAAEVSVRALDTKRSQVRKRRSLQFSVTTNEPISLSIVAMKGKTTIAKGSAKLTKAATRKLTVKLTKPGLKAAKGRKVVAFTFVSDARDSGGNATSTSGSGRLR